MRPIVFALTIQSAASLNIQQPQPSLVAAMPGPILPTPAAKFLDVGVSTASETVLLLLFLKLAGLALERLPAGSASSKILSQLTWLIIVQGSSRLQGMVASNQVGQPTKVLNPAWYDSLVKPSWNPPPWAFPLAWIPLKILQTIAANLCWTALERKTLTLPIVLFLTHIALGDVWNVQFFIKQRPLTGVFVITTFWGVLLAATASLYGANKLSGLLVAPTCVWVLIAASLNVDVWYLNKDR